MYYMLLIFLMMFYLTNTTKTQVDTDLSIVRYEHGVSLQNTGSIAALKAEWTILVLLQKPSLDNRMFTVTHSLKQMLLATNITVDPNVRRNCYINNFSTSVIRQFAVLQHYVSRISFQVNFEHLLVSLEQATYLYSRQMDAYYIQRRSLERQQLSEEILPPSELNSIIQTAVGSKFYAVQPMWYYTHVPITPIWSQPDTLIYHATLPFHDRERYLRYSLHSRESSPNSS